MILFRVNIENYDEVKEYIDSKKYTVSSLGLIGDMFYHCYSNKHYIIDSTDFEFERRVSVEAELSQNVKKRLFKLEEFRDYVMYTPKSHGGSDTFEKYTDKDFYGFLDSFSDDFNDILTFAIMSFYYDEENPDKSEYYITRSNLKNVYTNEDKTIFSTNIISEFGVDIPLPSLLTRIKLSGVDYEFENGIGPIYKRDKESA